MGMCVCTVSDFGLGIRSAEASLYFHAHHAHQHSWTSHAAGHSRQCSCPICLTVPHRHGNVVLPANVSTETRVMIQRKQLTELYSVICWFTMNLAGHHRRAVGTAFLIGLGNIAGIPAPFLFVTTDAPYYTVGLSVGIAMLILAELCCTAYLFGCIDLNRRRQRNIVGETSDDENDELAKGDLISKYRYVY